MDRIHGWWTLFHSSLEPAPAQINLVFSFNREGWRTVEEELEPYPHISLDTKVYWRWELLGHKTLDVKKKSLLCPEIGSQEGRGKRLTTWPQRRALMKRKRKSSPAMW